MSNSKRHVAYLCEWADGKSTCSTLSWTPSVGNVDNRQVKVTPLVPDDSTDRRFLSKILFHLNTGASGRKLDKMIREYLEGSK